MIYYD